MKKVAKKTAKRKAKKRSNPSSTIKLPLTKEELGALEFLRSRYESARILLDAYDEDNKTWNMNVVAQAFIVTKGDGGNLGVVPNTGRALQNKISELFGTVLDNSDALDLNIQISLDKVLNKSNNTKYKGELYY
jgi:hypothetical protein